MVVYSHSRLSSFEKCPLQFKFRYIEKIKPDFDQSIEGFLGNKVHDTLEWVYNQVKKGESPELDDVINYYLTVWNRDFKTEIKIVKEDKTSQFYFHQGIKFIIDYFKTHSPFRDGTIATEYKFFTDLNDDKKYVLMGYIDRVVHDKENNALEIHDYKTGNSIKTQQESDEDRQLGLYAIGMKKEFNEVKDINLIWHFLAHNKKIISKRTDEQLIKLKQDIIRLINQIESTDDFQPMPSILCKWCGFRSNCSLFKQKLEMDSSLI
jgi:putative RecB family exonuclease